jgi:non-heme chloroperoxidase
MKKNIVMIHGMFCGSWVWDNYKGSFEDKGYLCHTPVLRYHDINPLDKPDPALGTTSLLDYAQDLEKYIRKLDDKPLLMGHSMGGLLSQILGARGLASGLVLLTPASPSGINALKYSVIKSFWSILSKWRFWRKPHHLSFKTTVYAMMHLLSETDQKTVYDKLVYESGRAAAEIGYWYLDTNKATSVDETKVTCPVLVISGSEDRITPASTVKKVAEKYKSVSTYKEFQNHAHWVIGEDGWEEIAAFISVWIDGLSE